MTDVEMVNCYGKTRTEEFIKMNPCHCAPCVELDDGSAIWESNAVMRFLCNISPEGATLYPTDPIKRARVDLALDWRQTSFYPCLPSIGYILFGMDQSTEKAKEDFKKLLDEHFKTLTEVFLKDNKFIFSDTPTIADLSIALPLTFIKARSKFWEAVPEAVKEYYTAVLEAFPETAENFAMLDGMATGCTAAGFDAEP
jgi:glutathione S-transferase